MAFIHCEVGAGAEGGAAAAEDDHAHGVDGAQVEEGLAQLGDHEAVEGVAHVGTVQPDARHGPVEIQLKPLERHPYANPSRRGRRGRRARPAKNAAESSASRRRRLDAGKLAAFFAAARAVPAAPVC